MEILYNIPQHILSAIALTESGKTDKNTKLYMPWPWTANIGGSGRYFKTQKEALFTFKQLIARKYDRFDVGCMQVNWHYHKGAFSSIEEALDPYYNVRYAAEFLTSLYKQTGSWTQAAVYYHSKTPMRYQIYRKFVSSNWDKARDLMSPVNGRLQGILNTPTSQELIATQLQAQLQEQTQNPQTALVKQDKDKMLRLEKQKIKRMHEMAKLQAQIRQYAHNNYNTE
jgi:hypothetical protein